MESETPYGCNQNNNGAFAPNGMYGQPMHNGQPLPPVPPQNDLVWAILSTICCCVPFGVVSIVYSCQVNSKFRMGDVAGAQNSANKAKTWAIVAAVCGLISSIIGFVVSFSGAMADMM